MALSFTKILSPIQFNDPISVDALRVARQLVSESKGCVLLVHVIPADLVTPDLPGYQDLFATDEGSAARELEKLAAAHLRAIAYQIVVKKGDPAEHIVRAAQELGADMIVMPTHNRHALSRLLMGSVAEKVVREALCPVLIVRPAIVQSRD
jgi:nucleotide-binding universal stress UspA family protein